MLVKRTISAVVMLAAGYALALAGGWIFTTSVALILATAGWEYGRMYQKGGFHPSLPILIGGNALIIISSRIIIKGDEAFLFTFSLMILTGITHHIFMFPKHRETSGVDIAATLSGLVFIGFLGAHIVRLRSLPDGFFWLILAILPAAMSDISAFFFGNLLGKHKLAPSLSPNKSIEGYLGGVLTAAITGYVLGAVFSYFNTGFNGPMGLLIGLVIGVFCPLGDLGKSLIKRQFHLKDTSNLIPGHGGVLDRMDTLLFAGVISYYLITFFFL